MQEGGDVAAPAVAQGSYKQVDAQRLLIHERHGAAEVDLQLLPRRGLVAHGGQPFSSQRTAQVFDRPLDSPQADPHAELSRQILAHHVSVAPMLLEPLGDPLPVRLQDAAPSPDVHRPPAAAPQVLPYRIAAAAQLPADALGSPAQRLQRQHLVQLLWRQHRLAPPVCPDLGSLNHSFHESSFAFEGGHFSMSLGGQFFMSSDSWWMSGFSIAWPRRRRRIALSGVKLAVRARASARLFAARAGREPNGPECPLGAQNTGASARSPREGL
jgi:hypothetical protein